MKHPTLVRTVETLRYQTVLSDDPERIASQVLEKSSQLRPPTNIEHVLSYFGDIRVVTEPLEGDGYLLELWDGRGEVLVSERSRSNNNRRWRFTVAHELGHWIINRFTEKSGIKHRTRPAGHDEIERWCNRFACGLLLPEKWISAYIGRVENLGNSRIYTEGPILFDVSREFFVNRLSDLFRAVVVEFEEWPAPSISTVTPEKFWADSNVLTHALLSITRGKAGNNIYGPTNLDFAGTNHPTIFVKRNISGHKPEA